MWAERDVHASTMIAEAGVFASKTFAQERRRLGAGGVARIAMGDPVLLR